jgi:hypothetical protein
LLRALALEQFVRREMRSSTDYYFALVHCNVDACPIAKARSPRDFTRESNCEVFPPLPNYYL